MRKEGEGDYNSPQAHLLAASRMFRAFGTQTGKPLSAMSFVLWLRELELVKFLVTPAVLMAIFSDRLGSRGLTVMHFKESSEISVLQDGSTNVNFVSDFSPSASLPSARIDCSTYEDILDALHGLTSFGQTVWYDHMRMLMARLRNFVGKNKSADPENTRTRRRIFHDTACFALHPTSSDATTYALPDTHVATIGTSVAYLGGLTLRSGSAIQPPTAIQHSQTIQSGLAIQSPTAIQPVQAIQPVHPFNKASETSVLTSAEMDTVTAQPANPLDTACALQRPVASPDWKQHSSFHNDKHSTLESAKPRDILTQRSRQLRPVVSVKEAAAMHTNATTRRDLLRRTRRATLAQALAQVGITLPPDNHPVSRPGTAGPEFLLHTPLQKALSEFARRSGASLPTFVEWVRGQTPSDYRPNKNLVPAVLNEV
ncbi:unnamed protein product [Phytophthora fragariaefolia]|uniref:Unnamed protein product n=1 Tax=Phytophthora fragariaefolia TaxID=1490495 RepID=A0A9W6XJD8_9STRA|nr:unnamed protein product [Phytophthora fragariaefolia]